MLVRYQLAYFGLNGSSLSIHSSVLPDRVIKYNSFGFELFAGAAEILNLH